MIIYLMFVALLPITPIYYLFFHPLARYPGPLFARLSPLWRVYHEYIGDLPQLIHRWHLRHGPIIRVAPDELDISSPDMVDLVYKKGRAFPKSRWYEGFSTNPPNLFSSRDEDFHAMRRRQMAAGFSTAAFVKMEYIFDRHVRELVAKLLRLARDKTTCDLKLLFAYFSQDTNGELSFSTEFHTQEMDDPSKLPPNNDHILLAKLTGYVPGLKPWIVRYGLYIPWPYFRHLIQSRIAMRMRCAEEVRREVEKRRELGQEKTFEDEEGRVNLLTHLVEARDPETGHQLTETEIQLEALGFLGAGSHSTAASLGFLFWHLLHRPDVMGKVKQEIAAEFPLNPKDGVTDWVAYGGLESRLPYLSAVMKENFRLYPAVQNPMERVVTAGPVEIAGAVFQTGTVIGANAWCMHHDRAMWGEDADEFRPERWLKEEEEKEEEGGAVAKERYLVHFGIGHRACIGRNQALISMWKSTVEILRRFDLEAIKRKGPSDMDGDGDEELKIRVSGFAEIQGPLTVRVSSRV